MAPEPRHTALMGLSAPDVGPLSLSPSSKWSFLQVPSRPRLCPLVHPFPFVTSPPKICPSFPM